MKPSRSLLAALVTTVALAGAAAPAEATEHLQRIDEVVLSAGGNTGAQFVQLKDPGGNEPFPSPPYSLHAYDASGTPGTLVPLRGGLGGTPLNNWTVMSAPAELAFGVTGNDTAALNLNPTDGQVCFENGTTAKIACVNWGTIGTQVSGNFHTNHIPTPGDGQAALLCSGTYVIGTPSPKADNVCPSPGGGGGTPGGGGGGGTTPPVASEAPILHLGGKVSQKLGKSISVSVECHVACLATAAGTVGVPGASKNLKVKSDPTQIAEGKSATLKLKISSKLKKAIKKALKKGKRVKAKLTITAKNTAGSSAAKKTIKFKK